MIDFIQNLFMFYGVFMFSKMVIGWIEVYVRRVKDE